MQDKLRVGFINLISKIILLGCALYALPLTSAQEPLQIQYFENSVDKSGVYAVGTDGNKHLTTLDKNLQNHLQKFVRTRGANSMAAVVVLEAQTGKVLAAVDGRSPEQQNDAPLFYSYFPIASLFKTVISAASFDLLSLNGDDEQELRGGCANVAANGVWLRDDRIAKTNSLSYKRAFAQSCNGFFAKVAVEKLGYGVMAEYAKIFGWGAAIPSDFFVPTSSMPFAPEASLSVQTVGGMAAGLGRIYTNVFHVAWQYMMIANGGYVKPLQLLASTPPSPQGARALKATTIEKLQDIMPAVVGPRGTAGDSFRSRKFRDIRNHVGGKTGTLSGTHPKGINTWFAGMMPVDKPKYVVAAIVVINDLWHIRGPDLAAEAFWALEHPEELGDIAQK